LTFAFIRKVAVDSSESDGHICENIFNKFQIESF